jgi:hypothetical protein
MTNPLLERYRELLEMDYNNTHEDDWDKSREELETIHSQIEAELKEVITFRELNNGLKYRCKQDHGYSFDGVGV